MGIGLVGYVSTHDCTAYLQIDFQCLKSLSMSSINR